MMFGDMKCYLITIAGMLFFFYASKKGVDWDDPTQNMVSTHVKKKKDLRTIHTI